MKNILLIFTALVLTIIPVSLASAQSMGGQYWCDSYWSAYPCANYYGNSNYSYAYPNSYYQTYPYTYGYTQYSYPTYTYPAPTCTITASQSGYGSVYGSNYAQPVTLSWSSGNATTAFVTGVGTVAAYGSAVVYPINTTTYTMNVTGPGGSGTCVATYYYQNYQNQVAAPYYPYQSYQQQHHYPHDHHRYTGYTHY